MHLTIVLRKEVDDTDQAQVLVDLVTARLADHPSVNISASVNEAIVTEEDPE